MAGTKEGAKKGRDTKLKKDSEYYSRVSKSAKKPRGGKNSPGSFKKGHKFASAGGAASKRKASKILRKSDKDEIYDLEHLPLSYEKMPRKKHPIEGEVDVR